MESYTITIGILSGFLRFEKSVVNSTREFLFKKISSNPKIGIFCDVTAYRISLYWVCFENFRQNVNLSVTQPPFNSKQKQKKYFVNFVKNQNDKPTVFLKE